MPKIRMMKMVSMKTSVIVLPTRLPAKLKIIPEKLEIKYPKIPKIKTNRIPKFQFILLIFYHPQISVYCAPTTVRRYFKYSFIFPTSE